MFFGYINNNLKAELNRSKIQIVIYTVPRVNDINILKLSIIMLCKSGYKEKEEALKNIPSVVSFDKT